MPSKLNAAGSEKQYARWFHVLKPLFIAAMLLAFFLLGLSMVRHRFFQGGRIDRYGHITQ